LVPPLMALSPVSCAGFHVHSKESGVGKTTAMNVGASIWGSPKALVLGEDDTQHSRMNRSEVSKTYPCTLTNLLNLKVRIYRRLYTKYPVVNRGTV